MTYVFKTMNSPVGMLKLIASDGGLAAVLWENDRLDRVCFSTEARDDHHPILIEAEQQLGEYFAGQRTTFTVKLDFVGTEFQKKVWQALIAIPFGQTRSYGELARQIGAPGASRAVGAANGKNPISIIGPCHRVVGANGKLTGFAGGLEVKRFLLGLESGRIPA